MNKPLTPEQMMVADIAELVAKLTDPIATKAWVAQLRANGGNINSMDELDPVHDRMTEEEEWDND